MPGAIPLNDFEQSGSEPKCSQVPASTQTLSTSFSFTTLPAQWWQLGICRPKILYKDFSHPRDAVSPLVPKAEIKLSEVLNSEVYKCTLELITSSLFWGMERKGAFSQHAFSPSQQWSLRGPNSIIRLDWFLLESKPNFLNLGLSNFVNNEKPEFPLWRSGNKSD